MADISNLEKMGSELKCPICLSLLNSAVSIACNHVFCNSCILESMKSVSSCPVCKVPFRRRELRAAPHMDNLVSIFKSMEFATGTSIVSTQLAPKNPDGSAEGNVETCSNPQKPKTNKRKPSNKSKKLNSKSSSKNPVSSPVKMPSFPAKKRVHVTPFPLAETPVRPEKVVRLSEPENQYANKACEKQNSPSLSPFFWLREEQEEDDGEDYDEGLSPSLSQFCIASCFSDMKDSDDEIPLNSTPTSKTKVGEVVPDSETFECTQRPYSPKLCSTPLNKGKKKLDQNEEAEPSIDQFNPVNESQDFDLEERKSNFKRKRKGKTGNSVSSNSTQAAQNSKKGNPLRASRKNYKKVPEKTSNPIEDDNFPATTVDLKGKIEEQAQNSSKGNSSERKNPLHPRRKSYRKAPENITNPTEDRKFTATAVDLNEKIEEIAQNSSEVDNSFKRENSLHSRRKKYKKVPENMTNPTEDDKFPATTINLKGKNNKEQSNAGASGEETKKIKNMKSLSKIGECSLGENILKRCENVPSKVTCAFCRSADVTEVSGEMVHYHQGKPVIADFEGGANIIHSHKNCLEWAPDVYFEGDVAVNLTAELARSKRIKCSCCGVKGAALGCLESNCRKSFHFTCAKLVPECRWDDENFVMLCPLHGSSKLPIETSKPKNQNKKTGTLLRGLSINGTSSEWKWPAGSPSKWVLSCSSLSDKEKELVLQFSRLSGVPVLKSWSPNITHIIASTDAASGACKRTLKYLMAILNGKWILTLDWIRSCMDAMEPVDEEKFEITLDVHGIKNGPKLGRLRVINKQPKLFNGMRFYFTGDYTKSYRGYLQDLITAAGGTILQRKPISRDQKSILDDSSETLVIYSIENHEKQIDSSDRISAEARVLADAIGGKVANSGWIMDSIAACKLQPLS